MAEVYRIRRKSDGRWSRGGVDVVAGGNTQDRAWTDKIERAKIWRQKNHLNSHLSQIQKYCDRYSGYQHPTDWEVVIFVVKEVESQALELKNLRFEG